MANFVSHQPETPISARYWSSVDMVHVCDRDFDIYCCFYYIFEFRKLIYIFRLKKLISIYHYLQNAYFRRSNYCDVIYTRNVQTMIS